MTDRVTAERIEEWKAKISARIAFGDLRESPDFLSVKDVFDLLADLADKDARIAELNQHIWDGIPISERLSELEAENASIKALYGAYQEASNQLCRDKSKLESDLAKARERADKGYSVIRKCADALGNGAAITSECTDEFHALVPAEIYTYVSGLRSTLAKAREEIESLSSQVLFATTQLASARSDALAWQPIETAPKDGEHVLIAVTGGPHGDTVVEAYWHVVEKSWWLGSTSPAMDYADPITEIMYGEISHWQNMPASPRPRQAEGGGEVSKRVVIAKAARNIPSLTEYLGDDPRGEGFEEWVAETIQVASESAPDSAEAAAGRLLKILAIAMVEGGQIETKNGRDWSDTVMMLARMTGVACATAVAAGVREPEHVRRIVPICVEEFRHGMKFMADSIVATALRPNDGR